MTTSCGSKGRVFLKDKDKWTADIVISPTPESQAEAKVIKGIFSGFTAATDCLDDLLEKFSLTKTLRGVAWIARFAGTARLKRKERMTDLLRPTKYKDNTSFVPCHSEERREGIHNPLRMQPYASPLLGTQQKHGEK